MFEVSVKLDFSAAHNLRGYKGKCEKLHGHNWIVEAVFSASEPDKNGMIIDFKDAKKMLKRILSGFDHRYLNEIEPFKKINPTSENIARFIFQKLAEKNKKKSCKVVKVSVWETPLNCASYYE